MTSPQTLSFQRTIAAPPAEVFRAFTRATHLREWLCDAAQAVARPGGRVYFAFNSGYTASGRYTSLVPNEEIAFTWQGHGSPIPGTVTVKLTVENGNTVVNLELGNLSEGAPTDELQRDWENSLENLQSVLETGDDLRFTRRPMLGIFVGEMNADVAAKLGVPVQEGIRLDGTAEGQGARAAGLQQDDVIVAMDDSPITDWPSLTTFLQAHRAGDRINVVYYRGADKVSTEMELSARSLPAVPDNTAELAESLAQNYTRSDAALDSIIDGIGEEEAGRCPAAGEWSVKEALAHLIAVEEENHAWIADMLVGAERWTDDIENTTNIQPRLQGIIAINPTAAELMTELKRTEKETVVTVTHFPADFVARKSSYVRLGRQLLTLAEGHIETHLDQIRTALAAARA